MLQTEARKVGRMYETHILVNEELVRGATLEKLDNMFKKQSANLAQTFEEAVVHEVGHAKFVYSHRFDDIAKLYKELEGHSVSGISLISDEDGAEAIAEIEVMRFRGEKISKEAEEFYNKHIRSDD